jgi:kynurenine formamidase
MDHRHDAKNDCENTTMCDAPHETGTGWKGWMDLPQAGEAPVPAGPWIDLSHQLNENMPRIPFFPKPRFEQIQKIPEHPSNVTEIQMVVHLGTHVDAPCHFLNDAPRFEEIPLERLCGTGPVCAVTPAANGEIGVAALAPFADRIRPGDIVALHSGWSARAGTDEYDNRHPWLNREASEWLVAKRVKMLAVDWPTPDLPSAQRPADFAFPVHRTLLAHGVIIAEHIRNMETLAGGRAEFMVAALNITHADGAPARVIARAVAG